TRVEAHGFQIVRLRIIEHRQGRVGEVDDGQALERLGHVRVALGGRQAHRRQQAFLRPGDGEELVVVDGRVDTVAGEDEQPAAAGDEVAQPGEVLRVQAAAGGQQDDA